MVTVNKIEERQDGICLFSISNEYLEIVVSNVGCRIISIIAPDSKGVKANVTLGIGRIDDYKNDSSYLGAVVGRVANRISGATFKLNGEIYNLDTNDGENHLHGGMHGCDKKVFEYLKRENGIIFSTVLRDGESGYPGNVKLNVIYGLQGDEFCIEYKATTDKDTIVNFSNHMYFDLSGIDYIDKPDSHNDCTAMKQLLKIDSDKIMCINDECVTTNETLDVKGTPFDFRTLRTIEEGINEPHKQIMLANGYDHCFILNNNEEQITLIDEISGRCLTISTTLPAVHFYSGNYLSYGAKGLGGRVYENRSGVALETELIPNSINIEKNPSVILRKDEEYYSKTAYRFYARK